MHITSFQTQRSKIQKNHFSDKKSDKKSKSTHLKVEQENVKSQHSKLFNLTPVNKKDEYQIRFTENDTAENMMPDMYVQSTTNRGPIYTFPP